LLRTWHLNIQILRDSPLSIHVQIARAIIQDIKNGRLVSGSALPGSRLLANSIQVNRKTVIQAYEDLVAKGWLQTENKRGTFVANRHQIHSKADLSSYLDPILTQKNEIKIWAFNHHHAETIHFSQGQADPRLIPFQILSRLQRHALITASRELSYSVNDPLGLLALRQAILTMLNIERGLHAKLNQLCITSNPQMCLYLVAKTLITEGDYVIFEQLSCPNVRETLKSVGANLLYVNHDKEGIDTDHIEQLCLANESLKRNIKAVYVTPNQQIPTTVCMSSNRRKKLIELAERYEFTIIEDDAGFLHQFDLDITPTISSFIHRANIIYIATLSEALSNSVSLSFIVGEQSFIRKCAKLKMLIDQSNLQITELTISEMLHSGQLKKHIMHTQKIYLARKLNVFNLIQAELGEFVSINPTKSGLAFWLIISKEIRMDQLSLDLENLKINIHTGKFYTHNQKLVRGLLIGFANLNEEEAKAGVLKLKQAFLMQLTKRLSA